MKSLKKIFLTGILVMLPLSITVAIIVWLFTFFDSLLGKYLRDVIGIYIPGIGILATIILIFIIGLLTSNVVGKKLHELFERLFSKVPIVKTIYSPIKEIIKNFSSSSEQSFKKVVLIDFPKEGIKSIGFITNNNINLNKSKKVAVFIPTTPNPTNGFLVFAGKDEYEDLDMPVDVALKMIISMGTFKE